MKNLEKYQNISTLEEEDKAAVLRTLCTEIKISNDNIEITFNQVPIHLYSL